ncbi:hypothetical protein D0Z00_002747 [Geotrichum galactomycetum]|uniref:Uncharacterized protein n=1 Tax=Geotrichum galactomycetum TaxID=27317 RepID=A0ACB6V3A5_9ASCO|nr:hypothetical protein D0Z00_002747 [Geotrichum candidum]
MSARFVFPKALKELRFHFSQTGEASVPLRQFLTKNYPAFKQENPTTPVLIREAFGVRPAAFARFEYGKESKVHLDGINEEQIEKTLNSLINQK